MEQKWNYVAGISIAGQFFSIWTKGILGEDGKFTIETKAVETTSRQMKKDEEEHAIKYIAKIKK
jgi:hypothetical protein